MTLTCFDFFQCVAFPIWEMGYQSKNSFHNQNGQLFCVKIKFFSLFWSEISTLPSQTDLFLWLSRHYFFISQNLSKIKNDRKSFFYCQRQARGVITVHNLFSFCHTLHKASKILSANRSLSWVYEFFRYLSAYQDKKLKNLRLTLRNKQMKTEKPKQFHP